MRSCDTVAKRPIPYACYGSFKMLKVSDSEFDTVGADEFVDTVTEGVVHGVYQVVAQ